MSKTSASKEETKIKEEDNETVERQVSNEAESSDENQTDTSETSSVQELPCPPKLVSSIKEEKRLCVIRSVKQENKPTLIPPVPKLVKIELTEPVPYDHYSEPNLDNHLSSRQINKSSPSEVLYSTSVIASSHYKVDHDKRRLPVTTQPHENYIVVENDCPASIHASRVSHAATITTNHHIQPRMSTIMSTGLATQGEVTKNLGTSDENEARTEQPLKRKRGRPPGKTTKFLKSCEVKIAPKIMEDDVVHIKVEDQHMCTDTLMESEEYSPEVSVHYTIRDNKPKVVPSLN